MRCNTIKTVNKVKILAAVDKHGKINVIRGDIMETFLANLKNAVHNRETVIIGGGIFTWQELKLIVREIEKLQSNPKE